MSPQNISEGIFKNLLFRGHLLTKTSKLKAVKQVLYLDQPTAQRTHCRDTVTSRCSTLYCKNHFCYRRCTLKYFLHPNPSLASSGANDAPQTPESAGDRGGHPYTFSFPTTPSLSRSRRLQRPWLVSLNFIVVPYALSSTIKWRRRLECVVLCNRRIQNINLK